MLPSLLHMLHMSPDLVLFVFTIWVENNFLLNTCLLLQVYGWGRGEHGRMGFGDNDKSSKMVPQKVNLLAGEDIIQVSSTYAFGNSRKFLFTVCI